MAPMPSLLFVKVTKIYLDHWKLIISAFVEINHCKFRHCIRISFCNRKKIKIDIWLSIFRKKTQIYLYGILPNVWQGSLEFIKFTARYKAQLIYIFNFFRAFAIIACHSSWVMTTEQALDHLKRRQLQKNILHNLEMFLHLKLFQQIWSLYETNLLNSVGDVDSVGAW